MSDRIKLVFKSALYIILVSFIIQFVLALVYGFLMSMIGNDQSYFEENTEFLILIISSILTLPFVYLICLKAAQEAYRKKILLPKQKGINVTFGIISVTVLITCLFQYLLSGSINVSFGVLPILVAILAGQKADHQFNHYNS